MNVKNKPSDCLRPLLLGAVLLASGAQAQFQSLDRVVAIVDNDVIMYSQLDQRLREVEQTIAKRGGQMPPQDVMQQQVLTKGERWWAVPGDEAGLFECAVLSEKLELDRARAPLLRDIERDGRVYGR